MASALLADFSIEATVADVRGIAQWRPLLADGAKVFLPHFRGGDFDATLGAVRTIADSGLAPTPHLAARNIRDEAELHRMIESLAGAGAQELLLLGGGENPPLGGYTAALQILQSGAPARRGIRAVGFAGHPEAHPQVAADVLWKALADKIAAARDYDVYIATQFCFAVEPFVGYVRRAREAGIEAPIRLGVAGRVNAAKLLRFAAMCGIGASLGFLRRRFGAAAALLAPYAPEELLRPLGETLAREGLAQNVGVHFYPFGAIADTVRGLPSAGRGGEEEIGARRRL